ncbi:hypothetical protein ACFLWX_02735 [Chloroflexota bacterium]
MVNEDEYTAMLITTIANDDGEEDEEGGSLLQLDDGSLWMVPPSEAVDAATWLPTSTICVKLVDPDDVWSYELINGDISVRASKFV